jgi:putative addiction module CopG family antidote
MHIRFSEIDDSFIKKTVEQGFYLSETELVRDAVRRMRETLKSQSHFKEAVAKGQQDIADGKTVKFTPELMNEIKETAIKKAKNGEGYNSNDAIPS